MKGSQIIVLAIIVFLLYTFASGRGAAVAAVFKK